MEMKATGFLDTNVDLTNPNFAEMARAMGIKGVRVEAPQDLHAAVEEVFAARRAALLDVVTARQELVMPPATTLDEAHKFGVFMLQSGPRRTASELNRSGEGQFDALGPKHGHDCHFCTQAAAASGVHAAFVVAWAFCLLFYFMELRGALRAERHVAGAHRRVSA